MMIGTTDADAGLFDEESKWWCSSMNLQTVLSLYIENPRKTARLRGASATGPRELGDSRMPVRFLNLESNW